MGHDARRLLLHLARRFGSGTDGLCSGAKIVRRSYIALQTSKAGKLLGAPIMQTHHFCIEFWLTFYYLISDHNIFLFSVNVCYVEQL